MTSIRDAHRLPTLGRPTPSQKHSGRELDTPIGQPHKGRISTESRVCPEGPSSMPKSLLVADDSLTIRKVIGMIFATEDFQITSVDNGLEAISRARELRPDLVLADVTMPGRSGYEVCEA